MKKRSIAYLQISVALYSLAANFAHPVEPAFYQALQLPDWTFGTAFACMAAGNFLFAPFWGQMAERFGAARIMAVGFFGYAAGQFFFLRAVDTASIVLARLFAGVFIAAVGDAQIIYILAVEKKEKTGTSLALSASLMAIFTAFGYLIGGLLGNISIYASLWAQVIVLAGIGVLVLLFLGDQETTAGGKFSLQKINPFSSLMDIRSILTAGLLFFLLTAALTSFASNCYDQCFNYFIRDQYGFPPSMNGLLKGAAGIITLIADSTICVWLLKKTDLFKSILPVLLICAGMLIGIALTSDLVPFIVLNVVLFAFIAIYKPLLQAMMNQMGVSQKGILVGAYNSFSSFGTVAGSLTAGFAYAADPWLSFGISAGAFLVSAVLAGALCRERTGKE